MARSDGARDLLIVLTGEDGPLHRQIEDQVRAAIWKGSLRPGTWLPSSRMLAAELGVSRGVVTEAYGQLVAEGYLVTEPRMGLRVAPGVVRSEGHARSVPARPATARFNLRPGLPALDAFPRAAWVASFRRAVQSASDSELAYPDPSGHPALREALSAYLGRVRGTIGSAERIVLTQGSSQGLGLVCAELRRRGFERIAIEDPCHGEEREIVVCSGLKMIAIPVDDQGVRVDLLERSDAQAVLLTPAHQFPTGVLLSPERRTALVSWLASGDRYVIEDDYDAEFRYAGTPVGALQGLSPDRVIYLGSASKSLAAALRIGWLLVPPPLLAGIRSRKRLADLGGPTFDQLAFADFLQRGELDRHLRRMRLRYRCQRDALASSLRDYFPGAGILGIPAGLHLAIEIDGHDERRLRRDAEEASILVGGIRDHVITHPRPPTLLIGFAHHRERDLRRAVSTLGNLA